MEIAGRKSVARKRQNKPVDCTVSCRWPSSGYSTRPTCPSVKEDARVTSEACLRARPAAIAVVSRAPYSRASSIFLAIDVCIRVMKVREGMMMLHTVAIGILCMGPNSGSARGLADLVGRIVHENGARV